MNDPRQLELFSDGARDVAAGPRRRPPQPTEAELQAKLDGARRRLDEIVILGMKARLPAGTLNGLREAEGGRSREVRLHFQCWIAFTKSSAPRSRVPYRLALPMGSASCSPASRTNRWLPDLGIRRIRDHDQTDATASRALYVARTSLRLFGVHGRPFLVATSGRDSAASIGSFWTDLKSGPEECVR
jgi:hypothetical protein